LEPELAVLGSLVVKPALCGAAFASWLL